MTKKSAKKSVKKRVKKSAIKNKVEYLKFRGNSFLLVKMGSNARPACTQDLHKMEEDIHEFLGDKFSDLPIMVTHYLVDMEVITLPSGESEESK